VNKTFNIFRLLGIRYIMVYYNGGGEGPISMNAYSSSTIAPPVFKNDKIAIFEVPNTQLVYVTGAALVLDVPAQYQPGVLNGIMKNSAYSPDGVVVLNERCGDLLPNSACFEAGSPIPKDPINYSVTNLMWTETRISFNVDVSKPGYVLISSAYFPGWKATLDGRDSPIHLAFPGLPTLFISSAGNHSITLFYQWENTQLDFTILSAVTWGAWLFFIVFWSRRTSNANKRFKEMLGTREFSWDPE
jgi:hypothetical protein